MASSEIVSYIETQRKAGFSDTQIRKNLEANGWSATAVSEAFTDLDAPMPVPKPSTAKASTATSSVGIPSIPELLRGAWEVYKAQWQTFLTIQIIPAVISFAFGLLVGGVALAGVVGGAAAGAGATLGVFGFGAILIGLAFLLLVGVSLWAQAALLVVVFSKEALSVSQAFSQAKKYIVPSFLTSLLTSFIVFGASLFFVIPGIIFAIMTMFSLYIVVAENKSGFQAIVASRRYVSNHWLEVLAKVIVGSILIMLPVLILSAMVAQANESLGSFIESFGILLFSTPLLVILAARVYEALRQEKGEIPIVVTAKQRVSYGLLALIGAVAIPVLIFFSISFFSELVENGLFDMSEFSSGTERLQEDMLDGQSGVGIDPETGAPMVDWNTLLEEAQNDGSLSEEDARQVEEALNQLNRESAQ